MSELTSPSLLVRVQANDAEAWRRLVFLYSPLVLHWCRREGLGDEDAADVLQEVLTSVARTVAGFEKRRQSDTFRGWLWTITRNKIRDQYRRRRIRPEAEGGSDARRRLEAWPDEHDDNDNSPPPDTPHGELYHRALELIHNEFEERTWRAFWRTTVEEHAPADVAAELELSVNAVYKAKSRVLARLRDELGDLLDE